MVTLVGVGDIGEEVRGKANRVGCWMLTFRERRMSSRRGRRWLWRPLR